MQCVWGGGLSLCQLITLPVCLCYHHRSWSGARAAGVEYVCTDMQEAGGVSQHLSWMAPSLFEYLFFFQPRPPNPVTACPFPSQPLARLLPPPPPLMKLEKKAQQLRSLLRTTSFYFWRGNVWCVPVCTCGGGGWCKREEAEEEDCVYVYMYRCECTCPYVRA